jgi:hypothetical protein
MASIADSRFKQRAVIKFLVHENESVVNIHKCLCAVYGSCAVDRSTVELWAKGVKASGSAETELRDLPRAGRPATANTPNMLNGADAIIRADRRIKTRQLALQLSISTGSVCFRRVGPGKNPAEMFLQHDNARPHTSVRTREHITKMGWTVLPHPSYSPDLAPSDFHLFGSLKDALRGTHF